MGEPSAAPQLRREAAPAAPRAADDAFLELVGVRKSYGAQQVVHDLSLSIRKGEFVSLLGPSGCGKTTTLRMIAGFVPTDGGRIHLGGERIDQLPTDKRGATMVFQNYALFPHFTVAENVAFGLRMQKVAKAEIARRVGETLELVRLTGYDRRFPKELSGGQQQRVALARAIVLNPRLLLLDEPLSNLDAKLRHDLRRDFVDIHRYAGTTTVFVTHDLEEAFSLSDRVAVMDQGRVEQFDTPANIFMRPRTRFIAEFVGHSNVIAGPVLARAGGGKLLALGGLEIALPDDEVVGANARLAIPGHLIDLSREPVAADNCLAARIAGVSYLGATIQLELAVGELVLHAELPASARTLAFAAGENVFVSWRLDSFIPLPGDRS